MTRRWLDAASPWLGSIPADWTESRFRYEAVVRGGQVDPREEPWSSMILVAPNHVESGTGRLIGRQTARDQGADSGKYVVSEGEVMYSKIRPALNKAAIAAENCLCSADMYPVAFGERVYIRFGWYFMLAKPFHEYATAMSMRVKMPKVNREELADAPWLLPPPGEQRLIADYLDRETARIDTLIEEQQGLIELLKERRSAIRERQFVGTDEKQLTTIGRVLRPLARPAVPGLGVVTAYRDGTVTLRSNRRDDGYTFSDTEHGYQEIRPGDLVFHALDGFAGAVGISDSHGNATPVYHVCETTAGDFPEYIAMLLRYLGTSGFLATQAPSVRQRSIDFRNWSTFARVPVALPPADVQLAVVAGINDETSKIDTLIVETEQLIELARERRAALVTSAVTGQIDVRAGEPAKVA